MNTQFVIKKKRKKKQVGKSLTVKSVNMDFLLRKTKYFFIILIIHPIQLSKQTKDLLNGLIVASIEIK